MTLDGAVARSGALATDRLSLRKAQVSDAEALFAVRSEPAVTRQYGQEPDRSVDDSLKWIQNGLDNCARHEAMTWAITLKGKDTAIGECCIWNIDRVHRCAEIGYELHPAYWRKGIMTEALTAILAYGFGELGLHRMEANPLASNIASQGLLLKLGFKREGTLRQRHFFHDRFDDQIYFGLLEDEWAARPTAGP